MTLNELKTGESGKIKSVKGNGALRRRFLDMGLTPGAIVTLQKTAPMGDPVEISLRGYELTIRLADAEEIEIEKAAGIAKAKKYIPNVKTEHPRLGEREKNKSYHSRAKPVLPKGEKITFALVGNPNCGKTTLFNQLTGANQRVGNFPGVTVDKKDGVIRGNSEATITDLPGIYSLSPYSAEEIVTRDFLINGKPSGIINIADASNIERNLYLTMQLMELGIPMTLALNMMDEVRANGGSIRINELERELGIPVVPISAAKNEGIDELINHAVHTARYAEKPSRIDFCRESEDKGDPVGAAHRCIHAAAHLIEPQAKKAGLPVRFASTRMIEGDEPIKNAMSLDKDTQAALEGVISLMETEGGLDREAALANMRFSFIEELCEKTVVKPRESKEHKRSVAIDKILTGKYTAIPCFIGIMAFVFIMTFSLFGAFLSDLMTLAVDGFTAFVNNTLTAYGVNAVAKSLVIDGILNGVGSVISFLPTIVTLFFLLSILEDTGYMARVTFFMDKPLRKAGLSGRSFAPMLIGFGCSVPAIMATRTLSSERDRKMTILLTPFMSCSAKLTIYGVLTSAFFPKNMRGLIMVGLYGLGIACAFIYAMALKKTAFKGEPAPFVMELPNYRLPSAKSVFRLIWDKAKGFVKKAFTIILLATVIIWFLQTFDFRLNVAQNPENSLLAVVGNLFSPLFAPLGIGDWRVSAALITGFTAKENVVSTLTILLGENAAELSTLFTPFTAVVFLIFTLLYTPCVAAVATVKKEWGGFGAAFCTVVMQCAIAWAVAFLARCVGLAIGLA